MKTFTLFASIIAVVAVALPGCSAKWHLKRAARHELIAISKGAQVKTDTVFRDIPVFIERVTKDTLFISQPGDTVVLEKDRLKLKYVRLPGDTVWIEAECAADTVIKTVPVIVEKKFTAKSGLDWWILILIGFFGAIVLYFIVRK